MYDYARKAWARAELGERLDEILAAMPQNIGAAAGGKKDAPRGSIVEPRDTAPTLADLDIDKKLSVNIPLRRGTLHPLSYGSKPFEGAPARGRLGRDVQPPNITIRLS